MVRFIHTSDWQLGMTRHFLAAGVQEHFSQARIDALRKIGKVAREKRCDFVLVAGDAFDSNQVDRRTVARALEALRDIQMPVYILPANHDSLNAASVYTSPGFTAAKPQNVHIITSSEPIPISNGFELVGTPWFAKKLTINPLSTLLQELQPVSGLTRICVAHGAVDIFSPDNESAAIISLFQIEKAIREKTVGYLALGDRHSLTQVGNTGRIWYSGTPEVTDFRETEAGYIQFVELGQDSINTESVYVGEWSFLEWERNLLSADDILALSSELKQITNKERTAFRLKLTGTLTLTCNGMLSDLILNFEDLFGSLDVRENELAVIADNADFRELNFSGFVDATVQRLRDKVTAGGAESMVARDALMLLLSLERGNK